MSTQLKRPQLGTALLDWAGQGTPLKHFRKQDDLIKGSALTWAEAAQSFPVAELLDLRASSGRAVWARTQSLAEEEIRTTNSQYNFKTAGAGDTLT